MLLADIDYCELHGIKMGPSTELHEHHINTRGAGGDDIRENVIKLSAEYHTKAHAGEIPKYNLIEVVARREGKTPEEICQIIGLLYEEIFPENYVFDPIGNPLQGNSLDEADDMLAQAQKATDDCLWMQAAIFYGLHCWGMNWGEIAAKARNKTKETVKQYARTYRAFPTEDTRALDKEFTIHKDCAATGNPPYWLDQAVKNEFSTRQLREAIKAQKQGENIIKIDLIKKVKQAICMLNEVLDDEENTSTEVDELLFRELDGILKRRGQQYEQKDDSCSIERESGRDNLADRIGA